MKKHIAKGFSGVVMEMVQATGQIRVDWLAELCNGTVKEGYVPEDWKSSLLVPVYKDSGFMDHTEGYNC